MKKFLGIIFLLLTWQGVMAQSSVKAKADALVDKKASCISKHKSDVYYYIQIYHGKDLNRAKSELKKFKSLYPNAKASIKWENPEYKVWTGEYFTKFEVEQAMQMIKEDYPDALIVYPRNH